MGLVEEAIFRRKAVEPFTVHQVANHIFDRTAFFLRAHDADLHPLIKLLHAFCVLRRDPFKLTATKVSTHFLF